MPFGCVTLGDKKDYNQPSEVTDRYDLGQVIKTEEFCEIFRAKEKTSGKLYTCKKFLKRDGRKGEAPQHPAAGGRLHHPQGVLHLPGAVSGAEGRRGGGLRPCHGAAGSLLSAPAGPRAGRSSTGSWTRATTRRRTPATSSGRCWRPSPTCTRSRSCTGTSRWVPAAWRRGPRWAQAHPWVLTSLALAAGEPGVLQPPEELQDRHQRLPPGQAGERPHQGALRHPRVPG
uniref:CaM kinase-like vesicle-associated protein n=1 Tax=Anser cygnoides TaxID=8845 RepID=A0A8B9EX18_ANSCY